MNSTTLPPLKPRNTTKLYGASSGMNATIATSGVRNGGGIGTTGRTSTSSNGIQVQQLYDNTNTQKAYYTTNGQYTTNAINSNFNNTITGAKSPSADSMHSNKSLMQAKNNQTNSQSNLSMTNQQSINSTSQRRIQPMSPETAMKNYMQKLTTFEHHEIFNYSEIYFIGQNAKKIHGVIGGANNNGYDDENGSYKPVQHDQIYYRFEVSVCGSL